MNPQGKGGAFAPIPETVGTRATSTWRDEHLENCPGGGSCPLTPVYGSVAPLFHPLPSYADAAGSSLHQRGEPRSPGCVPLARSFTLVMGGLSRSLAETFQRRSGR